MRVGEKRGKREILYAQPYGLVLRIGNAETNMANATKND